MPASTRTLKIALVTLSGLVVLLGIALVVSLARDDERKTPRRDPALAPVVPVEPTAAPVAAKPPPRTPPRRRLNDLGQPLNEDGRPIGPADKLDRHGDELAPSGELPMTPPRLEDPTRRAAYKEYWVKELVHRAEVFKRLEPHDGAPSAEEATLLFERLYDAGEPRRADETVEQALARREAYRDLWREALRRYGATPKTIASRGGDPQHGEPTRPPPGTTTEGDAGPPPTEPPAEPLPGKSKPHR